MKRDAAIDPQPAAKSAVLPQLKTVRLILREPLIDDSAAIAQLAGNPAIADTTYRIPHPYPEGAAEQWIAASKQEWIEGKAANFAIELSRTGELIGVMGMMIHRAHQTAELGYWIGQPYWNQGYCTEAGKALLDFGFRQLGLNRIYAHYFARNPASGCVLRKLGLQGEGFLRQHIIKNGKYEDIELYAILRNEWTSTAN